MKSSRELPVVLAAASLCLVTTSVWALTPFEKLGKKLYFDENLSEPNGQSCASCHLPSAGFADPDQGIPASEGVIPGLFGGRNSPTAAYAMYNPIFHFNGELYIGGQFLDGRATGNELGDPLADQALAPFLNPVEMANTSKTTVVRDALESNYKKRFISQCGDVDLSSDTEVDTAYNCIASAIGQFERTKKFARFSSKYDEYLSTCIDMDDATDAALDQCAMGRGKNAETAAEEALSGDEWAGLQLFMGGNNNDGVYDEGEGAACVACHVADWSNVNDYSLNVQDAPWAPEGMVPPIFSDFTYDNLGIPKSEDPLLVNNDVDFGLGTHLGIADENGKFKVSTLRNISVTAPYGHNGFFSTLKSITHFYNARDVGDAREAEVPETMNISEMGNLGLSEKQEDQLVVFMDTLKDGYFKSRCD